MTLPDHDAAAGPPPVGMAALTQAALGAAALAKAARTEKLAGKDDEELQPYPFFFYRDHSRDPDPDPLLPLVPLVGRVPNLFPVKMHTILSRPDLHDIIAWMPHGRSWRVLRPKDFEAKVIPQYFGHTKYASFLRQANGWGFSRFTQGKDQGSYFHPKFLRGLSHLCKTMKRLPKNAKKRPSDPCMEPDLFKVSEMHPVPQQALDDAIMLNCTMQGDPKARVPVLDDGAPALQNAFKLTDKSALVLALDAGHESRLDNGGLNGTLITPKQTTSEPTSFPPASEATTSPQGATSPPLSASLPPTSFMMAPNASASGASSDGAASFAAGFAAATAFLSQQHFSTLFQSIAAATNERGQPLHQGLQKPERCTEIPRMQRQSRWTCLRLKEAK